jgi:hypothetical protein
VLKSADGPHIDSRNETVVVMGALSRFLLPAAPVPAPSLSAAVPLGLPVPDFPVSGSYFEVYIIYMVLILLSCCVAYVL